MDPTGRQSGGMQAVNHAGIRTKHVYGSIVLLCFFPCGSVAKEFVDKFDLCNANLQPVFNGNTTFMGMNKTAMEKRGYVYTGWPRELPRDTSYPREKYITLTYPGMLRTSFPLSHRLQRIRMCCALWSGQRRSATCGADVCVEYGHDLDIPSRDCAKSALRLTSFSQVLRNRHGYTQLVGISTNCTHSNHVQLPPY
jgi:hypothetical protein